MSKNNKPNDQKDQKQPDPKGQESTTTPNAPAEEPKAEKEAYEVRDGNIKKGGSYKMKNGEAVLQKPPEKEAKGE